MGALEGTRNWKAVHASSHKLFPSYVITRNLLVGVPDSKLVQFWSIGSNICRASMLEEAISVSVPTSSNGGVLSFLGVGQRLEFENAVDLSTSASDDEVRHLVASGCVRCITNTCPFGGA